MSCSSCGSLVPEGAGFCPRCGQGFQRNGVLTVIIPPPDESTVDATTDGGQRAASTITPADGGEPVDIPPRRALGQLLIIGRLATAFILIVFAGGYYAYDAISHRDAAIAVLEETKQRITDANVSFQTELQAMGAEREQLAADLNAANNDIQAKTSERDALQSKLGDLQKQIGELQNQTGNLQKQTADLRSQVSERDRQLNDARQAGAQQQQRAQTAETRNAALASVVQIDQQIQQEFGVLITEYDSSYNYLLHSNYYAAAAAYQRAEASAARLVDLLKRKNAAT